jgi:23S rRNA pseudouridine1911/1915/1917 synthase
MTHPNVNQNNLDDYSDFPADRVFIVDINLGGQRLDRVLALLLPEYSRTLLQSWIEKQQVRVDGQIITQGKYKLYGLEKLEIIEAELPDQIDFKPEDIALDIVYEDQSILVINKPAGLVVHPGAGHWTGTLLHGLLFYAPDLKKLPRAGIVHRLDKDTSGLMVVAKNNHAQTDLVRQLQARQVKRVYRAIAEGHIHQHQTIEAAIGRDPHHRTRMTVLKYSGKEAVTHVRVLSYIGPYTYVECRLETGRTHQIRVHMKYIGHPLLADPVYSGQATYKSPESVQKALHMLNRQALHAKELGLIHPETKKTMHFRTPLPEDFRETLETIADHYLSLEERHDWDDSDVEVIYVREP